MLFPLSLSLTTLQHLHLHMRERKNSCLTDVIMPQTLDIEATLCDYNCNTNVDFYSQNHLSCG